MKSACFKILPIVLLAVLLPAVPLPAPAQEENGTKEVAPGVIPPPKAGAQPVEEVTGNTESQKGGEPEPELEPVPSAAPEPEHVGSVPSTLPIVPPVSRYEEIWQNSPFELEAAPDVVTTVKESFAKDYALSGMLKDGENVVVYMINRKTRDTVKVTREGGEGGFRLVSLQGESNNVRDVEATIEKDGEEARITYDKALMAASAGAAMKNHPRSQQNLEAQNPRQGAAANPQERSAAAAAARARSTELASRSGGGEGRAAQAGGGSSATGAQAGAGAPPRTPQGRRRIVLPKAPVSAPQDRK